MAEFRQNYIAAWRQREGLLIHIFVDDENMSVPIPANGTDEAMLVRIRSFYQMVLVGQGFPALVFPKQLQRIDLVEVSCVSLASLYLILLNAGAIYVDEQGQLGLGKPTGDIAARSLQRQTGQHFRKFRTWCTHRGSRRDNSNRTREYSTRVSANIRRWRHISGCRSSASCVSHIRYCLGSDLRPQGQCRSTSHSRDCIHCLFLYRHCR